MKTKLFLIVLTAYFLISHTDTSEEAKRFTELRIIGYSEAAAEHITKVEFKLIPEDAEYIALIED